MPDYYSPAVVQPEIALRDVSPLELMLLRAMFEGGTEDETHICLATEYGVDSWPSVSIGDLRTVTADSSGFQSQVLPVIASIVESLSGADGEEDVVLDLVQPFEEPAHLLILQDIVRRSAEVRYFTVTTAYTCSKPNSDGFGGRAALVTADLIRSQSTDELLETFLADAFEPPAGIT